MSRCSERLLTYDRATNINGGTYQHVALVVDGTSASLYMNGALVSTNTINTITTSSGT